MKDQQKPRTTRAILMIEPEKVIGYTNILIHVCPSQDNRRYTNTEVCKASCSLEEHHFHPSLSRIGLPNKHKEEIQKNTVYRRNA